MVSFFFIRLGRAFQITGPVNRIDWLHFTDLTDPWIKVDILPEPISETFICFLKRVRNAIGPMPRATFCMIFDVSTS